MTWPKRLMRWPCCGPCTLLPYANATAESAKPVAPTPDCSTVCRAAAVTNVSWYSASGSDNAVIAPPTPNSAQPPVETMVRIAMDRSAVPDSEK